MNALAQTTPIADDGQTEMFGESSLDADQAEDTLAHLTMSALKQGGAV